MGIIVYIASAILFAIFMFLPIGLNILENSYKSSNTTISATKGEYIAVVFATVAFSGLWFMTVPMTLFLLLLNRLIKTVKLRPGTLSGLKAFWNRFL